MQNKTKTNRQTANIAVIALLVVLVSVAVVFGGMSVWNASAANGGGGFTDTVLEDSGSVTATLQYDTGYTRNMTVTYQVYCTYNGSFDSTYATYIYLPQDVTDFGTNFTCTSSSGASYSWSSSQKRFDAALQLSGAQIAALTYRCTSTGASLPEDPVKDGHTFLGWYLDEAFTQPYDGRPITSDINLYAKFEIHTYTVNFNSNGGSEVSSQVVNWHDKLYYESPKREGYDFLGWVYADGRYYDGDLIEQDITLTAKWVVKMFTVTFRVDGEVYETMKVAYGTTFQEAMAANEKLFFMNLLNDEGIKIAKSGKVTADVTVPVGEMTIEEKVATFIGNNWWLLYLGGSLIVLFMLTTVIASVVASKRR